MDVSVLARLGLREVSTILPEALYLTTGIDFTRPTEIQANLTHRCNYECLQCACWRFEKIPEMGIDEWKKAFAGLKEFIGRYRVEFVGGEPFVKKGFLDLLEFCREQELDCGITTNGSAFVNDLVVDRFVAARPLKVDISVDGPTPDIHDRLRGAPGSLSKITAGISKLCAKQVALGVKFPIRIIPTLNSINFRAMPDLVLWVMRSGATSIDIHPIREWTEESKTILWPSSEEVAELETVIAELLRMKDQGAPIETSEYKLRAMPDHFLRKKVIPEVATCRVGMRAFSINSKGIVSCCGDYRPLGDLKTQSAREIWTGAIAREVRQQTVTCTKGCAYGCQAAKPIVEKIKGGLLLFRG